MSSWRCWALFSSLIAILLLIELTTQGFSRNLRLQNGLKLSSKHDGDEPDSEKQQQNTPKAGDCIHNHSTTRTKAWFILHVGPPKTATTTLQEEMGTLASLQTLAQDGYLYIGRDSRYTDKKEEYGMKIYRKLMDSACHVQVHSARQKNASTTPDCWQDFVNELEKIQGMNIIASDETFGFIDSKVYWDWQAIRETLSLKFNFKAVVSYRRFYTWLVSVYSQQQRESMYVRRTWNGPPVTPLFISLQMLMQNPYPFKYLYTDTLLKKLQRFNISVDILNIHSDRGIVQTFLCDVVNNAEVSCNKSIDRQASTKRSNVALNFDYDTIAFNAAEQGLVNTDLHQRPAVAKLIETFHQGVLNNSALPMICPSKTELQPLLQRSLELETQILSEFYNSPLGKTAHEQDFWKAADSHKFCSINSEALLRQERWRKFFRDLDKDTDTTSS